jgi:hypothetical protein
MRALIHEHFGIKFADVIELCARKNKEGVKLGVQDVYDQYERWYNEGTVTFYALPQNPRT